MSRVRSSILGSLSLLAVLTAVASGAQHGRTADARLDALTRGPYCGLYSLYAVACSFGLRPNFADLLRDEYLTDPLGCSVDDLCRAARGIGLHALPLQGLTIDWMRSCDFPMLLHVRSTLDSTKADHWIAATVVNGGFVLVQDPPALNQLQSFASLSARWNGTAIICSQVPIDFSSVVRSTAASSLLPMGLVVAAAILVGLLTRMRNAGPVRFSWVRVLRECLVVVGATSVLALIYHSSTALGFIRNRGLVLEIEQSNVGHFVDRVDLRFVKMHLKRKGVVIDARHPEDYSRGHLPGAINLPPTTSLPTIERTMSSVNSQELVLIYCQNRTCPYSIQAASILFRSGFQRLAIYENGWAEWKEVHHGS